MTAQSPRPQTVRFGAFEFNPRAKELRKQGMRIKLHGQPLEILELLLERPGEVVTREELQRKLWPADTFVDFEHGVNAAMKRLRAALDDDPESPRFIETLPRVGYRFVAQVDGVAGQPAPTGGPPQILTDSFTRRAVSALVQAVVDAHRSRTRWRIWAVVAITAVALAALWVGLNVLGWRDRFFAERGVPQIRSIAVLPLVNLSGDPGQEYFADGMTDALITELGKMGALRVISRTSVMRYKGANRPLREIARELEVDAVVEGSVARSGDRVRVTANLIDTRNDQHLWAETYDRDLRDLLALQSGLAQAVTQQIRVQLTPQEKARLARARKVDYEAYEAYAKGRYFAGKVTLPDTRKGMDYFEQAIQKDPTYAAAYAGLADGYGVLAYTGALPVAEGFARMKAAAAKALELDESLAEAHSALGGYNLYYQWDGAAAEREFKRAIELNPSYPDAHQGYADYLAQTGRMDEAIAEGQRAVQLDPLSPFLADSLAWTFFFARQYDKVIEQTQKALELEPGLPDAHGLLGAAYLQKGMVAEAIAEFKRAEALRADRPGVFSALGYAEVAAGHRTEAQRILGKLAERGKNYPGETYSIAILCIGLGEKDQAFAWLEKAYQARTSRLRWLKVDPRFDALRSDLRLADLLRRVGLPP